MRLPPYVAVHVYDESGTLVEIREGTVVDLGNGRAAVQVGDLPSGWSAVVAVPVPDESEQP